MKCFVLPPDSKQEITKNKVEQTLTDLEAGNDPGISRATGYLNTEFK